MKGLMKFKQLVFKVLRKQNVTIGRTERLMDGQRENSIPEQTMFVRGIIKILSRNTIRVLNSLDPDQAGLFVGAGQDPNCLQKLSADNTSRITIKPLVIILWVGPYTFVCLI